MTCTIKRPAATRDTFGQPTTSTAVASNVPCYWWDGQSWSAINSQTPGAIAVDVEHIVFAPGQDVRAGDHITTVTDHLGNVVFVAADYRVVHHVGVMRNHLDCTLRYGKPIGGRA